MKSNREEALAIASIKFTQRLIKGSNEARALLCNTREGLAVLTALSPYLNGPSGQEALAMTECEGIKAASASAEDKLNIDAYFSQRWAQFQAGVLKEKASLDAREIALASKRMEMLKKIDELKGMLK